MLRSVWAQRSQCILSHFHASPARFSGQAPCQCCYCVCRAPSILLHKVIVRLENNIQHCKGHSFLRPENFHVYQRKKPLNFVFGDVKLSKTKAVPAVNSRISDLWLCIFSVTGRGVLRGPVPRWSSGFMILPAGVWLPRAPSVALPRGRQRRARAALGELSGASDTCWWRPGSAGPQRPLLR